MTEEEKRLQELEAENQKLREEIAKLRSSFRKRSKKFFKRGRIITEAYLGRGLKNSIQKFLTELTEQKTVSKDTVSDLSSRLVMRFTRLGRIGFLLALIPILFTLFQTWLLFNQNTMIEKQNQIAEKQTEIAKNQTDLMGVQNSMVQNQTALMDSQTNIMKFQNIMFGEQNKMVEKQTTMIDWQNRLFENQNLLVQAQNNRLDQQTYLQEAERRSALVFLMGNIFDEMNQELKDSSNKKKYLSQPLIRQIISLSHGLRPYKFLVNDELTDKEYSPERGQLLVALLNSNIDTSSLYLIFKKADFTSTYLNNTNLSSSIISYIDLSNSNITNSNMDDCKLDFSDLRNVNFSGSTLNSTSFERTFLMGANLCYTELAYAKLENANLDEVLISKFSYMTIEKENFIKTKYSKEIIKEHNDSRYTIYKLKKIVNR
ncbi:MAG: pentapeptide repeat-containing protein [Bacteroidota bacterium]